MTNPDQQPAKRRAFSYTEMMNSGQQQLSSEQIAALEQQAKAISKQNKTPREAHLQAKLKFFHEKRISIVDCS